jgi:type II secretory pathway component GspD/PulD (secretin)
LETATVPALAGAGRPGGAQASVLWLEADEYGQLAQTDTHYVLFYPLRYHGGFNVDVKRGANMESIQTVAVAPVVPDKDIQLIAELKNVLAVEASHYSSLNLLVIKIPVEKRKEYIRQVKDLLDVLDAPRKQVAIEAKIVEISRDAETQLGVDWTATNSASDFFRSGRGNLDIPGSPSFGTNDFNVRFDTTPSGAHVRLDATLRALEAAAKLNVISEPNMVVEVGQTARILVGERVPVQTKWTGVVGTEQVTTELEPVGVRLFVTPLVVSEDTIRMHVMPQVSLVKEFVTTSTGLQNPIIDTRDAETVVSVQDGEFIKIGGLLSNSKIKNEVKVPLLGDIPFLGFLFKSWRYEDTSQDLIIYITPRIVRGPLIQPGSGAPFLGAGY